MSRRCSRSLPRNGGHCPLPTVELQMQGSRFLRLSSQEIMSVAEKLYQKGFISYPRTETDQFPKEFGFNTIIERQTQGNPWGPYAQQLLNGDFRTPRSGRHNDQAHPPIHPGQFCSTRCARRSREKGIRVCLQKIPSLLFGRCQGTSYRHRDTLGL